MGWHTCAPVVPNVVPEPLQTKCFRSGRRLRRFMHGELHECSAPSWLICKAAPERWHAAEGQRQQQREAAIRHAQSHATLSLCPRLCKGA